MKSRASTPFARAAVLRRPALAALAAALCWSSVGCNLEMRNDSRLKPYEGSEVFKDGRSSRPIVEGTVARQDYRADESMAVGRRRDDAYLKGVGADGLPVTEIPVPVTRELLERGRERYQINCAVCHGADGSGNGTVVQRGFPAPPSYHIDRLRRAPVGHFYDVITNGYGVMYGYWDRVEPNDRWAIAAYVRALQLSQNARPGDVPAEELPKLQSAP